MTQIITKEIFTCELNTFINNIFTFINKSKKQNNQTYLLDKIESLIEEFLNMFFNKINILISRKDEFDNFYYRRNFTQYLSWAIPSKTVLNEIIKFVGDDFVIEAASGTGIWSFLMMLYGLKVMPTDYFQDHEQFSIKYIDQFINTFENNQDLFPFFNVLFLSWPSYKDNWSTEILRQFKGNKFIYIGESLYGCCANDEFFEELENNWEFESSYNHISWGGIHDYIGMYRRKIPNEDLTEKFKNIHNIRNLKLLQDKRKNLGAYRCFNGNIQRLLNEKFCLWSRPCINFSKDY